MKFGNPYLGVADKIRMLQRWILVQSYIYYYMDDNIIPDRMYDMNAQQLIQLQKENREIKTIYSYAFKDFEGGTGFDLYKKLKPSHKNIIIRDAELALKLSKQRN